MDTAAFLAAVPPSDRAHLTARSNGPGLRHLAGHLGLIGALGCGIAFGVPGWPLLLLPYGVAMVFLFTLAHECTHQTPFRSRWLNEGAGHLAGLLLLLPFRWFRAFHLAHHRHTNLPGQDPELDGSPVTTRRDWLIHVSGWRYWRGMVAVLLRLARGRGHAAFIAPRALPAMQHEARTMLAVYALAALSLLWSPAVWWLWILPVLLGQPALRLYLLAEHGDCPPVADMFLNTRTTFTNRIVRFLAWNMPYHTEHHVWPQVPFHSLPALHARMRAHLGVTATGYAAFTRRYLARRGPR